MCGLGLRALCTKCTAADESGEAGEVPSCPQFSSVDIVPIPRTHVLWRLLMGLGSCLWLALPWVAEEELVCWLGRWLRVRCSPKRSRKGQMFKGKVFPQETQERFAVFFSPLPLPLCLSLSLSYSPLTIFFCLPVYLSSCSSCSLWIVLGWDLGGKQEERCSSGHWNFSSGCDHLE